MTSLLLKSNTLTAAMIAACWLCSDSLGLMLLWALVLVPVYLVVMAWWLLCCEHLEESTVPHPRYRPYKFIGADETKPRAHQPPPRKL